MLTAMEGATAARTDERGAILLIVLILSVTLSLLSMALLSTAEVSLRSDTNADHIERAERGARSGVEWGAAAAKAYGIIPFSNSVVLDTGVQVQRQTRAVSNPRFVGAGVSNGVTIRVGADLQSLETTRPYAFMSFSGTNRLSHVLTVAGPAYLGAASEPLNTTRAVQIAGDLDLVTTTTLAAGQVTHSSGVDNYGVAPLTPPAWDTSPFSTASNWTVPYTSYSGSTNLKDVTLNGVVVVSLAAGQILTLNNVTINGTLVVPWLYPPVLDGFGTPTIEIRGGTTIVGGTAETGNLAVLAPGCTLSAYGGATPDISGVCYVRQIDQLGGCTFSGQMLVRLSIVASGSAFSFSRPAGFVPDVPVGIQWAGSQWMIRWLGRQ